MTVLACDLGATRIKLGLVNQGPVIAQEVLDSHSDVDLGSRLPEVARALCQICQAQGLLESVRWHQSRCRLIAGEWLVHEQLIQ